MRVIISGLLFLCLFTSTASTNDVSKLCETLMSGGSINIEQAEPPCSEAANSKTATAADQYHMGRIAVARKMRVESLAWYRRAAEQGHVPAQSALATLFLSGDTPDYAQALKWNSAAANAGDITALNNLGIQYFNGFGITRDMGAAAKNFLKGAELGNCVAIHNLVRTYLTYDPIDDIRTRVGWWYTQFKNCGTNNGFSPEYIEGLLEFMISRTARHNDKWRSIAESINKGQGPQYSGEISANLGGMILLGLVGAALLSGSSNATDQAKNCRTESYSTMLIADSCPHNMTRLPGGGGVDYCTGKREVCD